MENLIVVVILAVISIVCFGISYLQFHEKGFLFNNAYIYASEQEREEMDKKPHYKQSGITFLLIGIVFALNTVEAILQKNWIFFVIVIVTIIAVIYAVVSSIMIEKRKNKNI